MPKTSQPRSQARDSYEELIRQFPLRPIRSEEAYDQAITTITPLIKLAVRDRGQVDYLEVLALLIHEYEETAYPIAQASPADHLRDLIEANGLTQAQLAEETGMAESTISDILSGRREISRKAMHAFARRFRVDPSLFV